MKNLGLAFRWGIVGTGKIAINFASQLSTIKRVSLHGVFSRNMDNAERFRAAFEMARAYDSFEDMLRDDMLDAVYIALPAAFHKEYCIQALRAKKPLLCEKPFALDARQTEEILTVSKEEGVFCMEAMWMRFSPVIRQLHSKAMKGEFGKIRNINIQVGYATPLWRLKDAEPGRGALLNFGVYGASLVQMFLGDPDDVWADSMTMDNALDESCTVSLHYRDTLATISASIGFTMNNEAVITGTRGRARIASPFYSPGFAELTLSREPIEATSGKAKPVNTLPKIDRVPFLGLAQGAFWTSLLRRRGKLLLRHPGENGLKLEAIEVMDCVRRSRIESETMPHKDTLSVARILDRARLALKH